MGDLNSVASIITVYADSLNNPVKRQRLSEQIKSRTLLCIIYEKPILNKNTQTSKKFFKKIGKDITG